MSNGILATISAWLSKVKTDVAAILVDTAAMQPTIATNLDGKVSEAAGSGWVKVTIGTTAGSGNWTIPAGIIDDMAFVLMAGGGGSGAKEFANDGGEGGDGGSVNVWMPVYLPNFTTSVPWSIGAGGAAITSTQANGNSGGDTTFGNLTAQGGPGGLTGTIQDGLDGTSRTLVGEGFYGASYLGGGGGHGEDVGAGAGGDGGDTPFANGGAGESTNETGGGGASLGRGGSRSGPVAPEYGGGGHGGNNTEAVDSQAGADGVIQLIYRT